MSYTGEDGKDTRFRLMTKLYPYWRRLAVALKFQLSDITVMEDKNDPVFHLLSEWLRGANQEWDSRPVTWATLITALRDTNVQEEANILEEHFVENVPVPLPKAEGDLYTLCIIIVSNCNGTLHSLLCRDGLPENKMVATII